MAGLGLGAALVTPLVSTVATAATPHSGAIPAVTPTPAGGSGFGGGFPGGGRRFAAGGFPGFRGGRTGTGTSPGGGGFGGGFTGGGGAFPGAGTGTGTGGCRAAGSPVRGSVGPGGGAAFSTPAAPARR